MKLRFHSISVRTKLVGACMVIGLITLTAGISFRMRHTERRLKKDYLHRADLVVWAFSGFITDECLASKRRMSEIARMVMTQPDVEYVSFYDDKKRMLAASGDSNMFQPNPEADDPAAVLADRSRPIYNIVRPIYDEADVIVGYMAAGFPTKIFHDAVDANRSNITYTWLIVMLVVGISAHVIMGRIIKPLETVRDAMIKVGDGDFYANVPVRTDDEIGVIAGEYNEMVAKLRDMYLKMSEANQKLSEINERKTEFLGTVAHDLRTPLTLIGGFAETLSNKNLNLSDAQRAKYLNRIVSETKKMAKFISDYLDITKIEEGMQIPAPARINTEAVSREAASEFDFETAEVIFAMRVEPRAAEITADGEMLERALRNIIGNALKYAPPKTAVTLEISRGENATVFSVSDSGPGVPDDMKEKIFEKFFSGSLGNSKKRHGTGLGLAIARSIVRLHGGDIRVENNLPRGSRFIFNIPDPS